MTPCDFISKTGGGKHIKNAQSSHFPICPGREALELPRNYGNIPDWQECTVLRLVLSMEEEGFQKGKGKVKKKRFQVSLIT